ARNAHGLRQKPPPHPPPASEGGSHNPPSLAGEGGARAAGVGGWGLYSQLIAMLPYSSRRAFQPGGTRQVASYSSTMHGPWCGVFSSLRLMMSASSQSFGPK